MFEQDICAREEYDPIFCQWWFKRHDQSVPDMKLGIDVKVEEILRTLGHSKEADFCGILRRAFESFDESGLAETERERRLKELEDWLVSKCTRYFYGEPCGTHLPQSLFVQRHGTKEDKALAGVGKAVLLIDLLEATFVNIYGRRTILQYARSLFANQQYDNDTAEADQFPHFNDRWRQSNDAESEFSEFKEILRKPGRGREDVSIRLNLVKSI